MGSSFNFKLIKRIFEILIRIVIIINDDDELMESNVNEYEHEYEHEYEYEHDVSSYLIIKSLLFPNAKL